MRGVVLGTVLALVASPCGEAAQRSAADLVEAVNQLGDFDYDRRMEASRALRRADPAEVAPLLADAVHEHPDSYVQFRALVLLYGVAPERARDAFLDALESPNDRVRAAAYDYFEHHPEPEVIPKLLAAFETERRILRQISVAIGAIQHNQRVFVEIIEAEGGRRCGR